AVAGCSSAERCFVSHPRQGRFAARALSSSTVDGWKCTRERFMFGWAHRRCLVEVHAMKHAPLKKKRNTAPPSNPTRTKPTASHRWQVKSGAVIRTAKYIYETGGLCSRRSRGS